MDLKPYDNQLQIPSDALAKMYYNNEHNATPIKMLIGNCDIQKESWVAKNKKDKDVIIISAHNPNDSLFTRWRLNRSLFKQIETARKNDQRIIWFCGDYAKRRRTRVLKQLPAYKKYAVVWEQNITEMLKDGYERPTLDEGFDDFTYIIS
jgi:hypothetical protein